MDLIRKLNIDSDKFVEVELPGETKLKDLKEWLEFSVIGNYIWDEVGILESPKYIYFEDEEDVTLYKLTWL